MPKIIPLLFVSLVLAVLGARAEVKLPPIFGDHMVLQAGLRLPVWGTADPGEKVSVSIAGRQAATTADAQGNWLVHLDPLPKTEQGIELTVQAAHTLVFTDVLIGDVWVCSGQSNMEFGVPRAVNAASALASANQPQIRLFTVPHRVAFKPAHDAPGTWLVCTPETLKQHAGFSAVAYFFGKEIQETRKTPVGLIGTYWGGTPAQAWTSVEALRAVPALVHYADAFEKTAGSLDPLKEKYEKEVVPAWKKQHDDWEGEFGAAQTAAVAQWRQEVARATAAGQLPPPIPRPPKPEPIRPVFAGEDPHVPGVLFNGMVTPLLPYGIKGAIWYQGEANASAAKEYASLFQTMIIDWRRRWGQGDFPFLFVQLAGFGNGGAWPDLRDSQRQALSLPNTGMAVALDVGEEKDIHPRNKLDVGHRLALTARRVAYGERIVDSGPVFDHLQRENGAVRIAFKSVGGGLVIGARPTGNPAVPPPAPADRLEGFEIAGADGKFVPAKAEIRGVEVIVSSEGVAAPEAVRYGWQGFLSVNLYNKEGLPAVPFSAR